MSNDKYRKAYNMVIEYEKEAHRKNQKRIAVGLKLIIIIPLIFLALLFFYRQFQSDIFDIVDCISFYTCGISDHS